LASADHRRSVPWHRVTRQGHPDGTSRRRRRRRWNHRGSASEPRGRALRWRAVAVPRSVHAADARSSDYRGSHWATGGGAGSGRGMSGLAVRRLGGLMGAAAFLTAQPPNRPTAQDPAPILDRASAVYDSIRTLQADFVQVIENPMI